MPKPNPILVPTEHQEQVRFCGEFEQRYPDLRYFAIPNGGFRAGTTANDLKAEGVQPGVPDLCIPAHLIWVEMKRQEGGRLRPEQKDWKAYLEAQGHHVVVGFGCDDALAKVSALLAQKGVTPFRFPWEEPSDLLEVSP